MMLNLKLFGRESLIGPYQQILVIKNSGMEDDEENILYKGKFLSCPSDIDNLEITYMRTNENIPDTIIFEVKCNEG